MYNCIMYVIHISYNSVCNTVFLWLSAGQLAEAAEDKAGCGGGVLHRRLSAGPAHHWQALPHQERSQLPHGFQPPEEAHD